MNGYRPQGYRNRLIVRRLPELKLRHNEVNVRKIASCLLFVASAAIAQAQPSLLPASISGVVTDAGTGAPLWARTVVIKDARQSRVRSSSADTDSNGYFHLAGLPPGHYLGNVKGDDLLPHSVPFDLIPGENLTTLDFAVTLAGTVSGVVTDQNNNPVEGAAVILVTKTYQNGKPRYGQKASAATDHSGRYSFTDSPAGGPYKVMVKAASGEIPSISSAPEDPAKRRRVLTPIFYPNARFADGAESVALHSAEKVEGTDFKVVFGPSYCAEGIMKGDGRPAALNFEISEQEVRQEYNGNSRALPAHGKSTPDGRFRICDLHSGDYRLVVSMGPEPAPTLLYSVFPLTIDNRDATNLDLDALRSDMISGDVVWEHDAPAQKIDARIGISLIPLDRGPSLGSTESSIPGQFAFRLQARDEYAVLTSGMPPGIYTKDITYGGISVLHGTLSLGTPAGDGRLRVVLARDGGNISVRVTDREGRAVPSAAVWVVPSITGTAAELESTLISGTADAYGVYATPTLPPGKYRLFATTIRFERTAENIEKLTNIRFQGPEVEIGSSGGPQVILQPITVF
jgi:hypothetical protein